jgi:hypothetical protein
MEKRKILTVFLSGLNKFLDGVIKISDAEVPWCEMGIKNKVAFVTLGAINFLIWIFVTVPLFLAAQLKIAPYLYYSRQEILEGSISAIGMGSRGVTFSNGDVMNDGTVWFVVLSFLLFFIICGFPWFVTLKLYTILGFKLPGSEEPDLKPKKIKYTTLRGAPGNHPAQGKSDLNK